MELNTNIVGQGVRENKRRSRENAEQFCVSLLLQNNKLSVLKQHTFIISSFWESWHSLPDFFVSESHKDIIQVSARSVVLSKAQIRNNIFPHSHDYWMNLVSCCRTEGFSFLLSTRGYPQPSTQCPQFLAMWAIKRHYSNVGTIILWNITM